MSVARCIGSRLRVVVAAVGMAGLALGSGATAAQGGERRTAAKEKLAQGGAGEQQKAEEPEGDEAEPQGEAGEEPAKRLEEPGGAAAPAGPPVEKGRGFEAVRAAERVPRVGTPLIAEKLYPMQNRWEFSGFFDLTYADKYVEHLGGHGSIGYHLFDWLALEAFGGYLVADESGILREVRDKGVSAQRIRNEEPCVTPTCEPQLPDLYETTWFAGADAQWAPFYGKISAFSEYDLSFQLYGILGGGAEGIQRRLRNGQVDKQQIRGSVNYGAGLRLVPWKWVALRLELRNYTGLNPDVEEHSDAAGVNNAECLNGYVLDIGGERSCVVDFSNNAVMQFGISFLL